MDDSDYVNLVDVSKGSYQRDSVNVSVEAVKGNITNANVCEVKCLKTSRNGTTCDSLSVLITFDEERLLEKIFIGYML